MKSCFETGGTAVVEVLGQGRGRESLRGGAGDPWALAAGREAPVRKGSTKSKERGRKKWK